jgi:hypothetical protein
MLEGKNSVFLDWSMAQVLGHLPNKCKALSSNPKTAKEGGGKGKGEDKEFSF